MMKLKTVVKQAFLGVILLVAGAGGMTGCRNTAQAGGIQTLHASTLRHTINDKLTLAALFSDGHHVLLTNSLFETSRLYLADLQAGTVKNIPIERMHFFMFLPVEAGVLVDPGDADKTNSVLLVTPDGQTSKLSSLDLNVRQIGNYAPIDAAAERVQQLVKDGQLDNLTAIRIIRLSDTGPLPARPYAFMNDRYVVQINHANERDLPSLQAQSATEYTVNVSELPEPKYTGLHIEVERAPYHDLAGGTDNRNILKITISRGGQVVGEYPLKGFYYYALVVGSRLYIVGDGIRFLNLSQL